MITVYYKDRYYQTNMLLESSNLQFADIIRVSSALYITHVIHDNYYSCFSEEQRSRVSKQSQECIYVYHNKTITAFTQDYNSSNAQGKILII